MKKIYRKELNNVQADETFKQHLKDVLQEETTQSETKTNLKVKLAFALVFICIVSGYVWLSQLQSLPKDADLPIASQNLPILRIRKAELMTGGLGLGGINVTKSNDPQSIFAHHTPIQANETISNLPVYENRNQINVGHGKGEDTYPMETGKQILASYMEKLGIDGVIKFNDLNMPYVESEIGTLELNGKETITLFLSDDYIENHCHQLYGDSQAEVMEHVQLLLDREPLLAFLDDPWIDVNYQEISTDDEIYWDIQISEKGENDTETFLNHQFHAISLSYNEQGNLWVIRFSLYDLENKIGDYPIKSLEQAKEDLLNGNEIHFQMDGDINHIIYAELVYLKNAGSSYHLPYYRFVVTGLNQDMILNNEKYSVYVEYYVPAIVNELYTIK